MYVLYEFNDKECIIQLILPIFNRLYKLKHICNILLIIKIGCVN